MTILYNKKDLKTALVNRIEANTIWYWLEEKVQAAITRVTEKSWDMRKNTSIGYRDFT